MGSAKESTIQKPLIEHVQDIQKHLTWIVLFVAIGSGAAYSINGRLLKLLQDPLGQKLYYTSPTGGIAFLFKLCIVGGIIFALPVILFNIFRFLEPVLEQDQRKGLYKYAIWSFILAYAGIAFAYFISLPSALHFLTTFGDGSVQSLINVNEYFNFALAYVAGFAVLFQIPLIVLFVNRIKPLKPMKMLSTFRYIIVASFVIAAMLTPTPDPFNQTMMAAPMIVLYLASIVLVMISNRKFRAVAKAEKKALKRELKLAAKQAKKIAKQPQPVLVPEVATIQVRPAAKPVMRQRPVTMGGEISRRGSVKTPRFEYQTPVAAPQPTLRQRQAIVQERVFVNMVGGRPAMVGNDFC